MKKKYKHLVALVFESVWAITPARFEQMQGILELRMQGLALTRDEIESRIAAARFNSAAMPAAAGMNASRVAMLNLSGLISHRINAMSDISGGTSTEMFGKAFDRAVADESVSAIVLNVDSGGGSVAGVPELADKIYSARGKKPIVAVANAEMGSAAYWISAAADQIVASPSAQVGSIGVLTIHTDASEADGKRGLKRTIIKSSAYKAEGNGYEPLTDAAQTAIRGKIDAIHGNFVGAVARYRGVSTAKVEAEFGQGRMLLAPAALSAGLVDRIATIDTILGEFGASDSPPAVGANSPELPTVVSPVTSPLACGSALFPVTQQTPALQELSGMDAKILTAMIRAGLCSADVTEEHAQAILTGYFAAKGLSVPTDAAAVAAAIIAPAPVATPTPAAVAAPVLSPPTPVNTASGMGVADLVAAVALAPLSAEQKLALQTELLPQASTITTSQVLARINAVAVETNKPLGATVVAVTADSRDKFRVAARDALLCRTWGADLPKQIYDRNVGAMVDWKPTSTRNFGLSNMLRLAEECIVMAGLPSHIARNLAPMELAMAILGKPLSELGISAADPAFNVSGMFSNLLLDAQNGSLRRSYMEVQTTFDKWMRQAESIPDFKAVHRVIGGELPDPRVVPEDGEFEETTLTDGQEQYKLVVWGERFSITWQAIVNDRWNAFSEIPVKQGRAMRRKQNKLAYGVMNDNAALGNDSVALFDTNTHKNLTTGANAPSVANLNTLYTNMAQQTGVSSQTTLGLEPKYIWGPPALRGTILQLLGSTADPASTNANVKNIWENALTPIIDAQLGASVTGGSDVRWGIATDYNDCDTIEYAYLQGLESPMLDQQMSFDRLAIAYRIYQAFAVKAIDFRGLQQQQGS
jgi:signal peptide peptidase SppA